MTSTKGDQKTGEHDGEMRQVRHFSGSEKTTRPKQLLILARGSEKEKSGHRTREAAGNSRKTGPEQGAKHQQGITTETHTY